MVAGKDFVDMCAVCKQGVSREDMDYQKGRVFHAQCFTEHGNTIPAIDPELAHLSARTRIELVQLKNLKMRVDLEEPQLGTAKAKPAKRKRRILKKKSKAKRKQAKTKKVKSKKRKTATRR